MIERTPSDRGSAVALLKDLAYVSANIAQNDPSIADGITAFQSEWQLRQSGTLDYETLVLITELVDAGQAAGTKVGRLVRIRVVASGEAAPAPGLDVQLVEHGFRDPKIIATGRTDADGRSVLMQPLIKGRSRWPLEVRVLDGGVNVGTSGPRTGLRPIDELTVEVTPEHARAPSELERIVADIGQYAPGVDLASLTEDGTHQDVTFLAANTSWTPQQLTNAIVAHRLAAQAGVDAGFFYALLAGNALRRPLTLASATAPVRTDSDVALLLQRAARLAPQRVNVALRRAVRKRIVPAQVTDAAAASLATLAKLLPTTSTTTVQPTQQPQGGAGAQPATTTASAEAAPTTNAKARIHRRLAKLTSNPLSAAALADAGLRSAAHMTSLGRTQFVKRAIATGALTAEQAHAAFTRASQVHTATGLMAANLRSLAAPSAAALTPTGLAERLDAFANNNPTLATLFQLTDLCDCQDCRSVSGPAAYLVDVLEFLKHRKVVDRTTPTPSAPTDVAGLQALLARRPDLGFIDLTCDNTNVTLPYIDVVCELLEEQVAPDGGVLFSGSLQAGPAPAELVTVLRNAGLDFGATAIVQTCSTGANFIVRDRHAAAKVVRVQDVSAAASKIPPEPPPRKPLYEIFTLHQTFRSAAELAAAPAYVNVDAYETLRTTNIAFHLPFDLYHQESRRYFAQFNVARADLMRALANAAGPAARDIAADALGLTDEERGLIVTAKPELQDEYWNTAPTPAPTALETVDAMLTRAELQYADLEALLATKFVNPNGALYIHHDDLSCDTTTKHIRGLDAPALDRIHRFLRLWHALGWPMATLDHAIVAARLGNGDISDDLLVRAEQLGRLRNRLGVPLDDLIILFGTIPTDGDPSRYAQLFANPTATGTIEPALQIDAVKTNEGSPNKTLLTSVITPLGLALGMSSPDVALLVARLPDQAITFANLTTLFGYELMARALGRSVSELVLLQAMTGVTLTALPEQLLDLVAASDRMRDAGIQPPDLQFLLTYDKTLAPQRAIAETDIVKLLGTIRAGLLAASDAERSRFDPQLTADENASELRRQLGRLPGVDADAIAKLATIVDRRFPGSLDDAKSFTRQLLGGFFSTGDIETAEDALAAATDDAVIAAARNALVQALLTALSSYFYRSAREPVVIQSVSDALGLDATLAESFLRQDRSPALRLLDVLDADVLIQPPTAPPPIVEATFPDQFVAVRRLHQMARFIATPALSTDDVRWLLAHAAALGWLRIENLPAADGESIPLAAWLALQDGLDLLDRLALQPVLEAAASAPADRGALLDQLAVTTGWDRAVLGDLDARFGDADYRSPATYLRLERAVTLLRRLGLTVAAATPLVAPQLDADAARTLRQALKARYSEADWLGVLKNVQDPLRQQKRDALVAYLLATDASFKTTNDLYDYFLIDVEMCSCQPTSRIVQAHSTVQLFVQRCLLGIEPSTVADADEDDGWKQWTWMRNYRVWEANRKVFLYPEDYIEPELRDDKSEIFVALENTLQQSELTDDNITAAANVYLEQLDDIAFLEVMTSCYEESSQTTHVFARTRGGDPPTYYHRTLIQEIEWTPWEKIDLDITGDQLVAFSRNGRLHLAWPVYSEEPDPTQLPAVPKPPTDDQGTPTSAPNKTLKIQLALTERAHDKWLPKRLSPDSVSLPATPIPWNRDNFRYFALTNPLATLPTFTQADTNIYISYETTLDMRGGTGPLIGAFALTGCKGFPQAHNISSNVSWDSWPTVEWTFFQDQRYVEQTAPDANTLTLHSPVNDELHEIFGATPGTYRVSSPQSMSVVDSYYWLYFVAERLTGTLGSNWISLGQFAPLFYDDSNRSYVIIPQYYQPQIITGGNVRPAKTWTLSTLTPAYRSLLDFVIAQFAAYPGNLNTDLGTVMMNVLASPEAQSRVDAAITEPFANPFLFRVFNFFHPLVCGLRQALNTGGFEKLLARNTQEQKTSFDFQTAMVPSSDVFGDYPVEDLDFSLGGTYSGYNWELFFHVPFTIAVRLSQDQQYEAALRWFHFIFNPTDTSSESAPRKYWRTKPFFDLMIDDYRAQRIEDVLRSINSDPSSADNPNAFAVSQWRANPFDPFVIARTRIVAFQQAVLMKYLDNLIAWGDSLFRQDTIESLNQATQLYVMADKLLGARPRVVPPPVTPPAESYNQLADRIDIFGEALLTLEEMVDVNTLPHGGDELPPPPLTMSSLYFGISINENLLQYWDTVADRLFKIRNCQNIDGIERTLALFAPPIDPKVLVAAAASGADLSQLLQGLAAPTPAYRFTTMAQKATELTQLVVSMGNSLLQAMEKRDAEALARLRADQELRALDAVRAVKVQQIEEAKKQIDVLDKSIAVTEAKSEYYHSREFTNRAEKQGMGYNDDALTTLTVAMAMSAGAAFVNFVPLFNLGIEGFGGTPEGSASFGGPNIAGALNGLADVTRQVAGLMQANAAIANTMGGYQRRRDDWDFQAGQADKELDQLNKQKEAAQLRQTITEDDLAAHDVAIANSQQTDAYLRSKFTNTELYNYMVSQIGSVYLRAYQLAVDVAHKAERAFQLELGSTATFIKFGYWDSLKKGLLAGDRLLADIKQMEIAYLDQNTREYELTKNVSLAEIDPLALAQLKANGSCMVSVPEALFDLDHPGHYMRRLKQVSVSIPCVAGPYTSVGCKLSLIGNRYRKNTSYAATGPKYDESPGNDPRFVYTVGPIQSIATSRGENDGGLFDVNLRDERYLPFEGTGAISDWRIELPEIWPQFDYGTIADVVLHVRYTARDGGSAFRATVEASLAEQLAAMRLDPSNPNSPLTQGLFASVDLRQDHGDAWTQLLQSGSTSLTISAADLPSFAQPHSPKALTAIWIARTSDGTPDLQISKMISDGTFGDPVAMTFANNGRLFLATAAAVNLGDTIQLSTTAAAKLQDLAVIIGYQLSASAS